MSSKPKIIRETYSGPTLAQNGLEYFVSKTGQHVVVHQTHCGEDIAPNVYRFNTIEEARKMWVTLRKYIISRGYTTRVA